MTDKKKLLIIEDEYHLGMLAAAVLSEFDVTVASDAATAKEFLVERGHEFAGGVFDHMLDVGTTLDVLDNLPEGTSIPRFIILSAVQLIADMSAYQKYGMVKALNKLISIHTLRSEVRQLVKNT